MGAVQKGGRLENRSRRENLRIVGLKEGFEGSQPTTFLVSRLPKVLELDTVKRHFKIDRAHRSLSPKRVDRLRPVLINTISPTNNAYCLSLRPSAIWKWMDRYYSFSRTSGLQQNLRRSDSMWHSLHYAIPSHALIAVTHSFRNHECGSGWFKYV